MATSNEIIILAGGFGTRLKDVVKNVPKPMADINSKPFLHYLLKYYERKGIGHVILSVGYLSEIIKDHFGNSYGNLKISYAIEHEPLGTGGAILASLKHAENDKVFISNGDTMFLIEPDTILQFHEEKQADLTMVVRKVDDVSRYGSVLFNEDHQIKGFSEKNSMTGSGYINGGVYLVSRSFMEKFDLPEKFSIEKDFFEKYYAEHNFFAKVCNNYFIDIGIPEDYERAKKEFPSIL
jgi:D-glycero-alpha-D-manno-heptose 1-phosphate guanylyltransferase